MSTMNQFHDFSNYKFNLNESQLSDFDQLVKKLLSSDQLQSTLKIITDFKEHLLTTDGHNFPIENYSDTLLSQMYLMYRQADYVGSITDMLFAIAKSIDIGLVENGDYLGWSYIKATNVPGWTLLFQEHDTESKHKTFDYFKTTYFANRPLYHFDCINGDLLSNLDSGILLNYWNPNESYIFFEITFARDDITLPIFEIEFLESTLSVNVNVETNCVDVFLNSEIILAHPMMHPDIITGKFLLNYKNNELILEDALSNTITKITLPLEAIALHLKQSFSTDRLKMLSYYNQMSDETKINLFN